MVQSKFNYLVPNIKIIEKFNFTSLSLQYTKNYLNHSSRSRYNSWLVPQLLYVGDWAITCLYLGAWYFVTSLSRQPSVPLSTMNYFIVEMAVKFTNTHLWMKLSIVFVQPPLAYQLYFNPIGTLLDWKMAKGQGQV